MKKELLDILHNIKNKYLSKKNLFILLCLDDKKSKKHLEYLDYIYTVIINALRYEKFHRALIFLKFYEKICKKEFSEKKMKAYTEKLCKKTALPV